MTTYHIKLSPIAEIQIDEWKRKGTKSVLKKLANLFDELEKHPTTGTGKPEKLRGDLQGYWSRRITKADRMIYKIEDELVVVDIISLKGHYGDK